MLKTLKDIAVSGRKVLLRADLDVPLQGGRIGEDYRLEALLPTLRYLLDQKARVLIIGHAGRPNGRPEPNLSLKPIANWLSSELEKKVEFIPNYEPPVVDYKVALLENLRFWPGEERNDSDFAQRLAALADLYVNDSFAAAHRAHASIVGIPKYLPAAAGERLAQEVTELGGVLENPARPLVFILGGAKTETKSPLVSAFSRIADKILLGGLLMFDQGLEGIPRVIFPVDAVETFDIGPKSVAKFSQILKGAKTVVWNGPLGKWEESRFAAGTRALAEELAALSARTIVGGGDTIAALSAFGLLDKMSYVSLGGGAMLEFLAGKKLPGLRALGYH